MLGLVRGHHSSYTCLAIEEVFGDFLLPVGVRWIVMERIVGYHGDIGGRVSVVRGMVLVRGVRLTGVDSRVAHHAMGHFVAVYALVGLAPAIDHAVDRVEL